MDVVKKNPVEAVSFFVGIIVLVMGMILSATEGVAQIFGNILNFVGTLLSAVAGTWVYGEAAARKAPGLTITLYDLPKVMEQARTRLAASPVGDRVRLMPGSLRDDPLPVGCDAASLIRVLYDHEDSTVRALLRKVRDSLPHGGRLIVSEPMSGGNRPEKAGDVYFAFYCMAMRTGTVRSQARIAELLREAGFGGIETPRPARPFVTASVTAKVISE